MLNVPPAAPPSALYQSTHLTHDGLVLRPFEEADADAFAHAARTSVDTVGAWMPWCTPDYTPADALFWFDLCRESVVNGTAHDLGVFDASTGELLGGAGLNQINSLHRMANLGYWVRSSKQRQGIARRCVSALTALGFQTLGLQRIEMRGGRGQHRQRSRRKASRCAVGMHSPQPTLATWHARRGRRVFTRAAHQPACMKK
jgi:ribosomal-protein-serine acetyltransferase